MNNKVEYYENKSGKIAVLVSGGWGAGWSSWNREELAYDKRVVEFWLSKKDDTKFMREIDSYDDNKTKEETKAFFESIGYPGIYFGGFADIHIEWVKKGQPFRVDEYDGFESLETFETAGFITLT